MTESFSDWVLPFKDYFSKYWIMRMTNSKGSKEWRFQVRISTNCVENNSNAVYIPEILSLKNSFISFEFAVFRNFNRFNLSDLNRFNLI